MKIIAITSSILTKDNKVNTAYIEAFTTETTLPIILPVIVNEITDFYDEKKEIEYENKAKELARLCDALILTGGADINPINYEDENSAATMCNTQRDKSDYYLMQAFKDAGKPIMGICRGMQYLGLIFKLPNFKQSLNSIDELHNANENELTSRQEYAHTIELRGALKEEFKINEMKVNSYHHQGFAFIQRVKEGSEKKGCDKERDIKKIEETTKLKILANTNNIIEAFEHTEYPIFAVQWHPEEYGNKSRVINYFINKYINK